MQQETWSTHTGAKILMNTMHMHKQQTYNKNELVVWLVGSLGHNVTFNTN